MLLLVDRSTMYGVCTEYCVLFIWDGVPFVAEQP